MFSLIITIISIALVAALALATIYYGGSAFNRGSDGARASQLINEGQQINGAVTMFLADSAAGGALAADGTDAGTTVQVAELAPTYLAQVPSAFVTAAATADAVANGSISVTGQSHAVCQEVQRRAVNSTTVPATQPAGQVYGCFGSAAGDTNGTFFYRF
jgi:hypothetical protein